MRYLRTAVLGLVLSLPAFAAPLVNGVTPNAGYTGGGMRATLFGSGFESTARVFFGGSEATGVTVVAGAIFAVTPPPV
jgi:hypothetical protein